MISRCWWGRGREFLRIDCWTHNRPEGSYFCWLSIGSATKPSISEGNSVPLSLNTKTYCTPCENKVPLEFSYWRRWTYFKHSYQLHLPFCHARRCCFVLRIYSLDTESCHWVGPTGNRHFQDNNNRDQLQLCGDLNMHQWNRQVSWFSKHGHYHDNNYHHDVDDDNGRW